MQKVTKIQVNRKNRTKTSGSTSPDKLIKRTTFHFAFVPHQLFITLLVLVSIWLVNILLGLYQNFICITFVESISSLPLQREVIKKRTFQSRKYEITLQNFATFFGSVSPTSIQFLIAINASQESKKRTKLKHFDKFSNSNFKIQYYSVTCSQWSYIVISNSIKIPRVPITRVNSSAVQSF